MRLAGEIAVGLVGGVCLCFVLVFLHFLIRGDRR